MHAAIVSLQKMEIGQEISPYSLSPELWMIPCFKDLKTNEFKPLCGPRTQRVDWSLVQSRQA